MAKTSGSGSTASDMTTSSAAYSRRHSRKVALYMAAVFLYWMGLYLYVPTLSVYVRTKTDNLAMVGTVLSMYGLWQAIVRLPVGIAADWLGWRKPFLVGGFILVGLGAWLMGAGNDVTDLLIGRGVTGLAAATWVPLIAVFSALFLPEDAVRATAMLTLAGSLGRATAMIANGPLNHWGGYPLAFFVAAGVAAVATLVILLVPERRRPPKRPSLKRIGTLIVRRDVLLPALISAVAQYVTWTATFTFTPVLAEQLGASDFLLSGLALMNITVITLGNLLTTSVVKRVGPRRMIILSFVLLNGGMGILAFASTLPMVFVAQALMGLATSIGYPTLMGMSIEYVDDAERATAMGLHQSVYAIGMFAGPWLSGILADAVGIQPMFGVDCRGGLVKDILGESRLAQKAR